MPALTFALEALNVLPTLVALGIDITQFVIDTGTKIKSMKDDSRDPTDEEWDWLNKTIEDLQSQRVE